MQRRAIQMPKGVKLLHDCVQQDYANENFVYNMINIIYIYVLYNQ